MGENSIRKRCGNNDLRTGDGAIYNVERLSMGCQECVHVKAGFASAEMVWFSATNLKDIFESRACCTTVLVENAPSHNSCNHWPHDSDPLVSRIKVTA